MFPPLLRSAPTRYASLLLPILLLACSSPPARLYLLNSTVAPPQTGASAQSPSCDVAYGSSQPVGIGTARAADGHLLGVAVTVPEYLDRLDIIERTGANVVKPNYGAQWGEGLSVTAARALVENLATLLPSDDVVMLPSRNLRTINYQINLDLTKFETDVGGESVLAGRWSITDGAGNERASGHVLRSEQATQGGYEAMAAAMSRNLAAVSADIVQAVRQLPPSRRL